MRNAIASPLDKFEFYYEELLPLRKKDHKPIKKASLKQIMVYHSYHRSDNYNLYSKLK